MASRTSNMLHNARVALVFYCVNLAIQFFSRKIFLDYLGSEILGLNTTAQNLLGFLNIAELGIGAAVGYCLYKPLYEKDWRTINNIVSVQGWLYRRVAWIVIVGAAVLMCFFPMIFAKAQVPLWYTYGSFIALLTSALLGYFINYKQIVLSADQKEYKVTICTQSVKLLKIILQLSAIMLLPHGYVWWMVLEMVMAIVTSVFLSLTIKKEYPWLHAKVSTGAKIRKRYPEIIIKTKQLFFHKIGSFVLSQTSPIIIYAYASLTLVAIYGNYMLLVTGMTALMNAMMNGIMASVGNLVAEGDKRRIKEAFWELTTLRMWLSSALSFALFTLGTPMVSLWVGKEYTLPTLPFALMTLLAYIGMARSNDFFLNAYGLFQDIWAPMTEAGLNLGLSIILGYFFGLPGILCGVLISQLIIICGWKPYFLYRDGFHDHFTEYIKGRAKLTAIFLVSFLCTTKLGNTIADFAIDDFVSLAIYGFILLACYILLSGILLYLFSPSTKIIVKKIHIKVMKTYHTHE